MMRKINYAFPLAILMSGTGQAAPHGVGAFIEPAVTYEMGSSEINYPSPFASSEGDVDGFGIGARLGAVVGGMFFVGADARYSMPRYEASSVNYDESAKAFNWGPVAGMQMPVIGLRVWGSYIAGGLLDPDQGGSFDIKFKEADGYRVGAGLKLFFTSLNLEYQQMEYEEVVLEQQGSFSAGTSLNNVGLGNDTWILSVSFPIEFL